MPPYRPPGRAPAGSLPHLSLKKVEPALVRAQESPGRRPEYLLRAYNFAPPLLFLARLPSLPYILLRIRAHSTRAQATPSDQESPALTIRRWYGQYLRRESQLYFIRIYRLKSIISPNRDGR